MRIFGQPENLYQKKGYNMSIANRGSSVNFDEVYDYVKRNKKNFGELTQQEYKMFKK